MQMPHKELDRLGPKYPWLWIAAASVMVAAAYAPVLQAQFINYDDPLYVTANRHLFDGFSGQTLLWAFTSTESCNWLPLTWLSHLLDVKLYWLNPAGHHLTNLLLHLLNFLLLAGFLWRTTDAFWRSLVVASLFAFHPLHVESVAWVSERKDVLSAFFFRPNRLPSP